LLPVKSDLSPSPILDLGAAALFDKGVCKSAYPEDEMATEPENAMDYKGHEKSYSLFAAIMKWGTIASVVVTAIVVLLISN
jgi:hypothetical protein